MEDCFLNMIQAKAKYGLSLSCIALLLQSYSLTNINKESVKGSFLLLRKRQKNKVMANRMQMRNKESFKI